MNTIIPDLDAEAMNKARIRQDSLLKPKGALGQLETLSIQLVGMSGQMDWLPNRRAVIVFAADHGVMAHQVSTVPQAITAYMTGQFLAGNAAINVLTQQMNTRLTIVDVGINAEIAPLDGSLTRFVDRKIAHGTANFTQNTAMTAEKAARALQIGAEIAADEVVRGLDILIVGEMGIGNTTSASAIISAITGAPLAQTVGRGTGVDDATFARKISVIETALKRHIPVTVDTLMKLGGFEIGAMAGAMLFAASQRIPVVIDGLICAAAALIAQQINPQVTQFLIAGHCGAEPGHKIALVHMGLHPLLMLELRLGEGTGAVLALPLIEAAMRTLNEMGTLDVG